MRTSRGDVRDVFVICGVGPCLAFPMWEAVCTDFLIDEGATSLSVLSSLVSLTPQAGICTVMVTSWG